MLYLRGNRKKTEDCISGKKLFPSSFFRSLSPLPVYVGFEIFRWWREKKNVRTAPIASGGLRPPDPLRSPRGGKEGFVIGFFSFFVNWTFFCELDPFLVNSIFFAYWTFFCELVFLCELDLLLLSCAFFLWTGSLFLRTGPFFFVKCKVKYREKTKLSRTVQGKGVRHLRFSRNSPLKCQKTRRCWKYSQTH